MREDSHISKVAVSNGDSNLQTSIIFEKSNCLGPSISSSPRVRACRECGRTPRSNNLLPHRQSAGVFARSVPRVDVGFSHLATGSEVRALFAARVWFTVATYARIVLRESRAFASFTNR